MSEGNETNELDRKEECTKIFIGCFKCPTLTSARFIPQSGSNLLVNVKFSQRDFELLNNDTFHQSIIISKDLQSTTTVPPVYTNELLSSISPNGLFKALIRETEKGSQTDKLFKLEIWECNTLIRNYDLTALKIHGNVYADGTFGCLKWSATNDKLVYIAERHVVESEPFYKRKSADNSSKSDPGNKYLKVDNWGECFESRHNTVVVMWHADKKLPFVLNHIPENISPSKVEWAPDNNGIVGVGYFAIVPRFGVVYCTNRPSRLFYADPDVYVVLNDESVSVNSPRFNASGNLLVWLERSVGGPHHAGHRLMKLRWDLPTILSEKDLSAHKSIVIDLVDTSIMTNNNKPFYGIYCIELPDRCWISNTDCLLFSTPKEYLIANYIVHVESKTLHEITTNEKSYTVLDVYQDFVLYAGSTMQDPSVLYISRIENLVENIVFTPLTPSLYPAKRSDVAVDYIVHRNSNADPAEYCSILLRPKEIGSRKLMPLIVALHGGPHSYSSNVFSAAYYYFSQLGFAVFMVNYHGSIGVGERSLNSLLGKIGSLDATDVHNAVQDLFVKYPYIDKDNVMLFGGSHGGFLVTLLSGLYPNFYKAVVARNPVTNLALELWTTDIPDWAAVETGVELPDYGKDVITRCTTSIDIIKDRIAISPVSFVNDVKAPTLLLVGKNDVRVPPPQSISYYNMLRERNIKTKLLLYEDNHSLSTVPAEIDGIINSALWFIENLSPSR